METSSSPCTGLPTLRSGSWFAFPWSRLSITLPHSGRRLTGVFPSAAAARSFSAAARRLNLPPDRQMPMSLLQPNSPSALAPSQEFSSEERTQLLRLAHDAISSALERRELSLDPPTAHLAEPRGAFTSLHLYGELRGCVGY